MGWSGSLTASSALGSSITLTPDTSAEGGYTVSSFTAPRKGVYQFILSGSGGTNGSLAAETDGTNGGTAVSGGKGGKTTGYLLLEKNQTVYCGCGGTCSAAFVSKKTGSKLSLISSGNLYFVAGAGGAGGKAHKNADDRKASAGGNGGGTSGAYGADLYGREPTYTGGKGGTQSAGGKPGGDESTDVTGHAGSYGAGGAGASASAYGVYVWSGRGGDGYYGGGSGNCDITTNSTSDEFGSVAFGGGGGSGYRYASSLSHLGKTYQNSTSAGSGAGANSRGSVKVTYYARALLPVWFDGTQLERLFFNGTEVESLTYNGTLIYMRRCVRCLKSAAGRFACRAATRGFFPCAFRA